MQGLAVGWALSLSATTFATGQASAPLVPSASPAISGVERVAQWVRDSNDNQRRPFIIIDKAHARVFVFDARGVAQGVEAALLGMGRGDKLPPRPTTTAFPSAASTCQRNSSAM